MRVLRILRFRVNKNFYTRTSALQVDATYDKAKVHNDSWIDYVPETNEACNFHVKHVRTEGENSMYFREKTDQMG